MLSYDSIRIGNYVLYKGELRDYYNKIGRIISNSKIGIKDSYELQIKRFPKDEENIIKANSNVIMLIDITDSMLLKLGFIRNEKTIYFSKDEINVIRIVFIKKEKDEKENEISIQDDKGFRVIENGISNYFDEKEVMSKTVSVNTLNALQNYFELKLKRKLGADIFY